MLTKQPDWEARLRDFLKLREKVPFDWGYQDCALLVCDALEQIAGVDVAAEFRGYSSWWSAQRKMLGFIDGHVHPSPAGPVKNSLLELVAERVAADNGMAEVDRAKVQAGDAALCNVVTRDRTAGERLGVALGMVDFDGRVVCAGTWGLQRIGSECVLRAWRVQ